MTDDHLLHLRHLAAIACRDRMDESIATLRYHLEKVAAERPSDEERVRVAFKLLERAERGWSHERRLINKLGQPVDQLRLTQFDERVEAVADDLIDIADVLVADGILPEE